MGPLLTQVVKASWDAPPPAVADALRRAIADQRYEDGGHATWPLWRITGSVTNPTVDLRATAYRAPAAPDYGLKLDVRGDLLRDGTGTRLVARASVPTARWEMPLVAGAMMGLAILTSVAIGAAIGVVAGLIELVVSVVVAILVSAVSYGLSARSQLGAAPQVAAVLACLGTPSTRPPDGAGP